MISTVYSEKLNESLIGIPTGFLMRNSGSGDKSFYLFRINNIVDRDVVVCVLHGNDEDEIINRINKAVQKSRQN